VSRPYAAVVGETVIGLLHPGEMGAAVGRSLVAAGHRVLWLPEGRSPATGARAAAAGLAAADGGLAALARRAAVIVSVCPPHAALQVARQVAGAGFRGLYLDANAISPGTAGQVAATVTAGGADYVDGAIIGPPPEAAGQARLYLSGPRAGEVAGLFAGTGFDARAVERDRQAAPAGREPDDGRGTGAASAVKAAYAAWTKGSAALVLAARALARAEGVEDVLVAEWAASQPGLADRWMRAAGSAMAKGWRWAGEMEEIAAAMAAAGLPDGFHRAAAEVYRRPALLAREDGPPGRRPAQQGPRRSAR
jgi:3-hydroxyisobutyrate dehydrogenase-like beta-hydroxyacid dehydrogenase